MPVLPEIRLQWGRAPKSAETLLARRYQPVRRDASMGPRSEERGNTEKTLEKCVTVYASMGPRSEERGNAAALDDLGDVSPASMGPRSEERGNVALKKVACFSLMLQWGRAPKSAETSRIAASDSPTSMLQWGRAPKSAETLTATK